MSALKALFTILFLSLIFIQPNKSIAELLTGGKAGELNSQIIQEVKDVLQTPYLKFASKNLTGEVKVTTTVSSKGKIIFKDITGLNENLVSNVIEKLNSLNLWASPDYSNKEFAYIIKYKD
ncbi:MAG: hypothetical protein M3R36_02730 [Bacteroidota bacterium]|nr:hypothetical protein [Bacteroidota bacterium]